MYQTFLNYTSIQLRGIFHSDEWLANILSLTVCLLVMDIPVTKMSCWWLTLGDGSNIYLCFPALDILLLYINLLLIKHEPSLQTLEQIPSPRHISL